MMSTGNSFNENNDKDPNGDQSSAQPQVLLEHASPPPVPSEAKKVEPVVQDSDGYQLPDTFTDFLWQVIAGDGSSTSNNNDNILDTAAPESIAKESSTSELSSLVQSTFGYLTSFVSAPSATVTDSTSNNEVPAQPPISEPSSTLNESGLESAQDIIRQLDEIHLGVEASPPPLELLERSLDLCDPIMTTSIALQLRKHLPRRFKDSLKWKLIFSLEQHGISMQTLYGNMKQFCNEHCEGNSTRCASVLIIKTTDGDIFGGFVTECWRSNSGSGAAKEVATIMHSENSSAVSSLLAGSVGRGRSYYGTGESFVFKTTNAEQGSESGEHQVVVYEWAFTNDYFMLSEVDFLAMGGGDGKFSIYLDGDLLRGHCGNAPTFSNDKPLCSNESGEFKCKALEIWSMIL